MNVQIIGDGAFGSFLNELLSGAPGHFTLMDEADTVILAVPYSSYEDVASKNKNKHLINVCSVQEETTNICLKYSNRVTSIHPLFGARTPPEYRNAILTFQSDDVDLFLIYFGLFLSRTPSTMTPKEHDELMGKTHVRAIKAMELIRDQLIGTEHIPDFLIPHSFRMLRVLAKQLEDMPQGTMKSILANRYY